MRLEVSAADTEYSIGFRLTHDDRHVSALLTLTAGRWTLRYGDGDDTAPVTVDLLPGRRPWATALRTALRMCELHLMRR